MTLSREDLERIGEPRLLVGWVQTASSEAPLDDLAKRLQEVLADVA